MSVLQTRISWTDSTWNPTTGCTKVSAGCDNCYAEAITNRLMGGGFELVRVHPGRLADVRRFNPIRLGDGSLRPRLVFVNSVSDLHHEAIPDEFRDLVYAAMESRPHTIFQVLTKRPAGLRKYVTARYGQGGPVPDNLWLGVSIEDDRVGGRARIVRRLKEAVGEFTAIASVEPIIGPCAGLDLTGFDWVLLGGESGPRARPCAEAWMRQAFDAARRAGAAVHLKQWGTPRSNPLVAARMAERGIGPKAAFEQVCAEGLELAPEEKGGATLDGALFREKPPSYYRLAAALNGHRLAV